MEQKRNDTSSISLPVMENPDLPSRSKVTVLFVIGPPGAGKGTLLKRFTEEQEYFHFSVGDYLRTLSTLPDEPSSQVLGGISQAELRSTLKAGDSVEASTIVAIIQQKLYQEEEKGCAKFVIDGFPRADDAAELFEQKVCTWRLVMVWVLIDL